MREWQTLFRGGRGSDFQPGSSCLTRSTLESGLAKPQGPIRNKEHGKGCTRRGWSEARAAEHTLQRPRLQGYKGKRKAPAGSECLTSTAQLPRHGRWQHSLATCRCCIKGCHSGNGNTNGKHWGFLLKHSKIKFAALHTAHVGWNKGTRVSLWEFLMECSNPLEQEMCPGNGSGAEGAELGSSIMQEHPLCRSLAGRTAALNMNNSALGGAWLKIYILCLCHYKLLTVQGAGKKDSVPLIIYFLIQTKMEFYAPLITSAATGKTHCTSHCLRPELPFHFQKFFLKFLL